jgi:hypothetical protein
MHREVRGRGWTGIATGLAAAWLLVAVVAAQAPPPRAIGVDDMITMRKPGEVQISPDGR